MRRHIFYNFTCAREEMGNILEVKSLSCGYNSKVIINEVTFSVAKGAFTGIIGPNGAGKTTLLKAITRTLRPYKGEVFYQGEDIFKLKTKELARHIAVLPQTLEIPFSFSVEEFVSMGRFPHVGRFQRFSSHDLQVIKKSLLLTDTFELRERKINELSEGEKQRVIIAQGLAQEPEFLLLDEPTAHLDIAHQVQLLSLLCRLNSENGLTVMAILHDLNLASEFCRELILLNEGKIFRTGLPSEVLTYQNIEEVYKTVVIVKENPLTSKPYVFVVPKGL